VIGRLLPIAVEHLSFFSPSSSSWQAAMGLEFIGLAGAHDAVEQEFSFFLPFPCLRKGIEIRPSSSFF